MIGDPTEGALITAGLKARLSVTEVMRSHPRLDSIPFESQFQYMATLHEADGQQRTIYVKGSAEALLPRCTASLDADGNAVMLDRQTIEQQINNMARQGLRLLTFANKIIPLKQSRVNHSDLESGLVFLGLQGMIDPPRLEAIAAVHACQSAGIGVKMITGDHVTTAVAIARRMGLGKDKKIIAYTGAELAQMNPSELANAVEEGASLRGLHPNKNCA